jgi:hypothetical protein
MAEQREDDSAPNPALDKEKAEGNRNTVNEALRHQEQEPTHQAEGHQGQHGHQAPGGQDKVGMTNRPLPEEEREQSEVPPRGERKDSAHA